MPVTVEFNYKNVTINGVKVSEDDTTITVLLSEDVIVGNGFIRAGKEEWFYKHSIIGDVKISGQHTY